MKTKNAPGVDDAHEKGQMQGVAAVDGGWVPVSLVDSFLRDVEHRILALRAMRDRDWWDKPKEARQYGFAAEELDNMADEFRAQIEAATVRQPAPNTQLVAPVDEKKK